MKAPAEYTVSALVNGKDWIRIQNCRTEAEARAAIKNNERMRRSSFNGLIEPSRDKIEYAIWKAAWMEIENQRSILCPTD